MDFNKDSCKKSLDILSRSVYMSMHCDWSEEVIDEKISLIRTAAGMM